MEIRIRIGIKRSKCKYDKCSTCNKLVAVLQFRLVREQGESNSALDSAEQTENNNIALPQDLFDVLGVDFLASLGGEKCSGHVTHGLSLCPKNRVIGSFRKNQNF